MPGHKNRDFDAEDDRYPNELSSNGHWIFGSIYAVLVLIGFSFGVWAGAAKPKPVEVAEAKKETTEKPTPKAATQSGTTLPNAAPAVAPKSTEPEPKPKEPEPKAKEAEPKKEPEPKPKEPEPKPKEPEPKKPAAKAVAFKEVAPILRSFCGNCHGQVGKPKGGVDVRTVAAIMKGGDDGALVKPGDPEKSPLYESITAGRMPKDGKPGPSEKELALIRDWIASGAKERRRTVRRRGRCRMELTADSGTG